MVTAWRIALTLALSAAMATGAASPAQSRSAESTELERGERAGVIVDAGSAKLDPAAQHTGAEWAGLLTLPTRAVPAGTGHVLTTLTADVPGGATASVDVRGRTISGWSEWLPARDGVVALAEPTSEVQARLVLTGGAAAQPVVRAVELTPAPAESPRIAVAKRPALRYTVFATREGLVGATTANGHVIGEHDLFVALPSRRALSARDSSDYSVRVCAADRCAWAPVWDVGPWNTRDDYWNPPERREDWKSLPQGMPQAQMAHLEGFNDGRDQYDREVLNPAGIDLSDAVFHDALGLADNSWVTVDYLWTGNGPLATVGDDDTALVRSAPEDDAPVVGLAAGGARVPATCTTGGWLRIGDGQFVETSAVGLVRATPPCPVGGPPAGIGVVGPPPGTAPAAAAAPPPAAAVAATDPAPAAVPAPAADPAPAPDPAPAADQPPAAPAAADPAPAPEADQGPGAGPAPAAGPPPAADPAPASTADPSPAAEPAPAAGPTPAGQPGGAAPAAPPGTAPAAPPGAQPGGRPSVQAAIDAARAEAAEAARAAHRDAAPT